MITRYVRNIDKRCNSGGRAKLMGAPLPRIVDSIYADAPRTASGIKVWNQFTLESANHIFQAQFLFLQPPNAQLINIGDLRELANSDIKVSMGHP
jgi:hypothetical protein